MSLNGAPISVGVFYDKINANAIAPKYSNAASYAVGAFVTYKGAFYKNKTAISSQGEAWNPAHWDRITVDDLLSDVAADLAEIDGMIPNEASAQNKLADKNYVDTQIRENASTYRGSFATKAALVAVQWQTSDSTAEHYVDDNDNAVVMADESNGGACWRYIYTVGTGWEPQYKINDSAMTEAQLAALNSGATAAKIASIEDKYEKPETGIPKTDMAQAVQESLQKADDALPKAQGAANAGKLMGVDTSGNVKYVPVDNALSGTSENPVQNKAVKAGIDAVQENLDKLGFSVDQSGALNQTAGAETAPVMKDSTAKRIRDAIRMIAGTYDLSDYKSITAAVRNGDGAKIPNGTTFIVPHSVYGNIEFIVRRKNVDKVFNDANRPTLTIQAKYLLSNNGGSSVKTFQYDRKESLCAALTEAIPAGTVVKFTAISAGNWTAGTYHFTATNEIAAGSYLGFSKGCWDTGDLDTVSVQVFANAKATSASATYAIASGDGDATVDLGTMGTELNHPHRVGYGSNNELESGLLQFLNGSGLMSDIWVQKTKFDLMNTEFTTLHGFLEGFPQDFLDCLGLCAVHNITNDVYESPDSANAKSTEYTHNAYFWLPSRKEIYGTNENAREDSETQFAYYADIGTTNADKLMYAKGASSPYHYWLRTPYAGYAFSVRYCYTGNGGALSRSNAYYSYGVAPLAILA